jgi:hypothetical protein
VSAASPPDQTHTNPGRRSRQRSQAVARRSQKAPAGPHRGKTYYVRHGKMRPWLVWPNGSRLRAYNLPNRSTPPASWTPPGLAAARRTATLRRRFPWWRVRSARSSRPPRPLRPDARIGNKARVMEEGGRGPRRGAPNPRQRGEPCANFATISKRKSVPIESS